MAALDDFDPQQGALYQNEVPQHPALARQAYVPPQEPTGFAKFLMFTRLGENYERSRKAKLDADLTEQVLRGGGALSGAMTPENLEMLGTRLAASGHPGGASLIGQAEKMRANIQNRYAIQGMRSAPGILGAGVTVDSPQGAALMSNLTGDPGFDRDLLQAQNEALNTNQGLRPQPIRAPKPGLFAPLINSPYVGEAAKAMQNQINTAPAAMPANNYYQHFDRLQSLHSTGANQASARQDNADLRRDLANQADETRRALAGMRDGDRSDRRADLAAQRIFVQERQLSENYNALSKDFRKVVPQFQAAAKYVAEGKFDSSGDRALVFQYAKTLDPQDRVAVNDLRDINKLGNVPERIVQAVASLSEGKELPARVRQEMFATMRSRFENMNEQQISIEDEYSERAKRYMLNPSNVVLNYGVRRQPAQPAGEKAKPPAVIDFANLPKRR